MYGCIDLYRFVIPINYNGFSLLRDKRCVDHGDLILETFHVVLCLLLEITFI